MYKLTTNWPFVIMAYVVFAIVIIIGIKKVYINDNKEINAIFSLDETGFLRGIAALMVLFTHLAQKMSEPGLMYWYWFFGFLSVGFFMFASGYASYVQFQKKKQEMFKGYIIKRLIRLLIPFIVIDSIFAICFRVSFNTYIKSLLTIRLANNDTFSELTPVWFIFSVFYLGMAFYVSYKFFDEKKALFVHLALTIVFIVSMWALDFGFWWYNTALAYFYGILYAKYKTQITNIVQKKGFGIAVLFLTVVLAGIVLFMSKGHYTFIPQSVAVLISIIIIVFFFSKVDIRNSVLIFIGNASLELFLIQGLRGLYFGNNATRPGIYMVAWIVIVCVMAYVIMLIDNWIIKKITKLINHK